VFGDRQHWTGLDYASDHSQPTSTSSCLTNQAIPLVTEVRNR